MTFQKKATVTLAEVQEASIDTKAKLAALHGKRQAALLADNAAALDAINSEIAAWRNGKPSGRADPTPRTTGPAAGSRSDCTQARRLD